MRFGLPESGTTLELHPRPSSSLLPSSPSRPESWTAPFDALSESLKKLDKLCLKEQDPFPFQTDSENALAHLEAQRRSVVGSIDHIFDLQLQRLQKSVAGAIEEHEQKLREIERRRTEEEERKRRKAEELQRKAKEEAERKAKLEQERKEKELREKEERDLKEKLEKAKTNRGFTNVDAVEEERLEYTARIPKIKSTVVEEVAKNPALKKSVGAIKRKINTKLGQLSNSMRQLATVTAQVVELIHMCKQEPLAYQWILNFVSKSIVSQAETEVTVKPNAALPLARLTVELLRQIEGLDYYLGARFIKKCPLIIGYTCSQSTDEGRTRMGWKHKDNTWEQETKYEERIGGIFTLWAVISRLESTGKFPLFSNEAQWRFVARILNTEKGLLSDVHYVLFCNWWEASAQHFVGVYRSQSNKLVRLAVADFAALGSLKGFAAATRLQVLGEDLYKKQTYNSLKEMEP